MLETNTPVNIWGNIFCLRRRWGEWERCYGVYSPMNLIHYDFHSQKLVITFSKSTLWNSKQKAEWFRSPGLKVRGKVRECVIPPPEESTSVWLTEEPLLQIISFHYNLLLIIAKKCFRFWNVHIVSFLILLSSPRIQSSPSLKTITTCLLSNTPSTC